MTTSLPDQIAKLLFDDITAAYVAAMADRSWSYDDPLD
jgi:hypothetical protein